MTTTDIVLDRPADGTVADRPSVEARPVDARAGRAASLALGLWAVVGSLLAYGVLQTVLKASALFG